MARSQIVETTGEQELVFAARERGSLSIVHTQIEAEHVLDASTVRRGIAQPFRQQLAEPATLGLQAQHWDEMRLCVEYEPCAVHVTIEMNRQVRHAAHRAFQIDELGATVREH